MELPMRGFIMASALIVLTASAWFICRPVVSTGKDSAIALAGDGKTDNSEAIRELLRSNGSVVFARGTYRITEPIVVDLDKTGPTALVAHGDATLVMDGPGPALRFVGTHAGTAAPKTVQPNVWTKQRTPTVSGL